MKIMGNELITQGEFDTHIAEVIDPLKAKLAQAEQALALSIAAAETELSKKLDRIRIVAMIGIFMSAVSLALSLAPYVLK